jgi:hypothetical protein
MGLLAVGPVPSSKIGGLRMLLLPKDLVDTWKTAVSSDSALAGFGRFWP